MTRSATAGCSTRPSAADFPVPSSQRAPVPVFALYGETEREADVELVHIEDIRSRSERYDWEISPHLHRGLFQILVVLAGSAQVTLDGTAGAARAGTAVALPAGVVHAFRFEPGTTGYVLTVAETLLWRLTEQQGRGLVETLLRESAIVELGPDADRIESLLQQIALESRAREPGHACVGEWLVASLVVMIARRRLDGHIVPDDQSTALFVRFRRLVEEQYRAHLTVAAYAQALSASETRLDRLCRALTGRSAFDLVQERLILESRRKLVHVAAPVAMIAYELGFEDPAYFCRFFRRHTGMTPSAFRRLQREQIGGAPPER